MTYHVILARRAQKDFQKLSQKDQGRILDAFREIAVDPFIGKKLEGDFAGHYTVRVWPYRIIYRIVREIVTVSVVAIGHRQGVYRRLRR
jgi:mRNA interferase RelE/StbE